MDTHDTRELFLRFRDHGDPGALGVLFDRLSAPLWRLAVHLASGPEDAEDLVQRTFLTAIERAGSFDGRRAVEPWLNGILAAHARNLARARRRPQGLGDRELARVEEPLQPLLRGERRRELLRAVEGLASPYREVLRLRLSEAWSPQEIAARLDRSPGAVRVQLHRGLQMLRRVLPPSLATSFAAGAWTPALQARLRAAVEQAASASLGAPATTAALAGSAKLVAGLVLIAVTGLAWFAGELLAGEEEPASAEPRPEARAPIAKRTPSESTPSSPVREMLSLESTRRALDPQEHDRDSDEMVVLGRLVDDQSGEAIVGAAVWCSPSSNDFGWAPPDEHVVSDEEGFFRWSGEEARHLYAWGEHHAFHSHRLPRVSREQARAPGVDLGELRLPRGATIEGRVLTAVGAPVADALILHGERPDSTFVPGYESRPIGRSDGAGRFRLEHIPPSVWHDSVLFAVADAGIGAARFVLRAWEERRTIDIVLDPPATLSVEVVDPAGAPVPGVLVAAFPTGMPYGRDHSPRAPGPTMRPRLPELAAHLNRITDAEGRAHFEALAAGRTTELRVWGTEILPARHVVQQLEAAGLVQRMTVQRRRLRAIEGRVVDLRGDPLPGLRVQCYELYQGRFSGPNLEDECVADEHGRFRFSVEGGRPYDLIAIGDGLARRPWRVELPAAKDVLGVALKVHPATPLRGVVRDEHGRPVPGTRVSLKAPGAVYPEYPDDPECDEEGRFLFSDAIAGDWTLSVAPPEDRNWERRSWQIPVRGEQGQVEVVVREMPKGQARIRLEVYDALSGESLDFDRWNASLRSSRDPTVTALVDFSNHEKGVYLARQLFPGEVRLHARREGYASITETLRIDTDVDEHHWRIPLGALATVEGRVLAPEGLNLPRGMVFADMDCLAVDAEGRPQEGVTRQAARPDPDGSFRFIEVEPGERQRLHASFDGYVAQAFLRVDPAGEHRVELSLIESGILQIRGAARRWSSGHLRLRFTSDDEWSSSVRLASPRTTSVRDTRIQWRAGRVEWALEQSDDPEAIADPASWRELARGVVELPASGDAVIDLSGS